MSPVLPHVAESAGTLLRYSRPLRRLSELVHDTGPLFPDIEMKLFTKNR